jgi:hypothetical protein
VSKRAWRLARNLCWLTFAGLSAYSMVKHWLAWRFGTGTWPVPQGTGWPYQLESGFVPALTVLTLLGALTSMWHLHNCHSDRCWRLGKHKINGTPWCSKHEDEGRRYQAEHDVMSQILTAQLETNRLLTQILERP